MQKKIKILGVRFDNVTMDEAYKKALDIIASKKRNYICTPNPEMLLEAQKDNRFLCILNKSGLNIPDGAGIILASKLQRDPLKERVTGTDLMRKFLQENDDKKFLLGAGKGVAEKVRSKFQKANIVGTYSGTPSRKYEKKIRSMINKSAAKVLFVAYGAPAQELWIARNLRYLKTVKLAIGVGGAFDFLSGEVKRAPQWMRKIGLEWFYRLAKEPKRIGRIYNAVIKFPFKFISSSWRLFR